MKTFYQFLTEAPTPAGPSPDAAAPAPGAAPEAPDSIGGLGGGPGPGGPGIMPGGPPGGGLGGLSGGLGGPSLGPSPDGSQASNMPVQKYKSIDVWQALEKLIKNKNGQNQDKMLNYKED